MSVVGWLSLGALVACSAAIAYAWPETPEGFAFFGLTLGLAGMAGNWMMTKYVGCRHCNPGRWP